MKQRILSWLLVACVLCSLLPHSIVTASGATYSGTCGDNLTWLLDTDTGVLTISGTGAMEDYNYYSDSECAPWDEYRNSIKEVNVEEGVTTIGDGAFSECCSLILVNIPNSVITIGVGAFESCSYLTSMDIPNGVTTIGDGAFFRCSSLSTVTIPKSVITIGAGAFASCSSLTNVYITDIAAWCAIDFVDLEGGGTSNPLCFAEYLYINGELSTDIRIPYGVTAIGAYAFWNYGNLTSVTIPESVTTIGKEAFSCTGLTSVTIPASVTTIEELAFYYCEGLTHVHFLGDSPVFKICRPLNCGPFQLCNDNLTLCYTESAKGWDETYITYHHDSKIWNRSTEANCVGFTYTCNDCGEVYSVADSSAALGHEWNEGVVTTTPTTTAQGTITYTCIRCGEVKKEVLPSLNPFGDIHTTDYFYDPVLWAVQSGITNGTSATKFSPEAPCTRGQIVTFLWRACGSPEPKEVRNPFDDVETKAYYYKAVLWAVEQGITTGVSATKFAPDKTCTRGQVATFLWRSRGKSAPINSINPFSDIEDDQYYYDAVLWAVENQITQGTGKGKFSPNQDCTRGQIVTFLYRALEE